MADEHHGGQRCRVLDGLHGGRTGFNAWIPCLFKPNGHAGSLVCSFIERGPNVDGSQPIPNMALKNEKQKLDVNGSVVENNESPPAPTSAFIG
jgi:hypothetical protein